MLGSTVRLAACSLLALLAGCPRTSSTAPQRQGAGCPAASGVLVASYVGAPGTGRAGWVLPLHATALPPGTEVPDYAPLDAAAATAAGVPTAPTGTLWLATAAGEPCRVTPGGYYAAKVPGPPASLSYGVELEGCPAPASAEDAGGIVLSSELPPTGCRFEIPQPAAARLGQMDDNRRWQRPVQETPIPAALAPAIPPRTCAAPACEMLWAIGEVRVGEQPVAWTGAVNWLTVGDPAQPCAWPIERFSGFFVPGGAGAVKVTEGLDHPLVLSAVLADASGARTLLAEGPGAYATYDLVPGGARLARKVTWMLAPAAAWDAIDHLGPLCEPPAPNPAPLPADARPVSPY